MSLKNINSRMFKSIDIAKLKALNFTNLSMLTYELINIDSNLYAQRTLKQKNIVRHELIFGIDVEYEGKTHEGELDFQEHIDSLEKYFINIMNDINGSKEAHALDLHELLKKSINGKINHFKTNLELDCNALSTSYSLKKLAINHKDSIISLMSHGFYNELAIFERRLHRLETNINNHHQDHSKCQEFINLKNEIIAAPKDNSLESYVSKIESANENLKAQNKQFDKKNTDSSALFTRIIRLFASAVSLSDILEPYDKLVK